MVFTYGPWGFLDVSGAGRSADVVLQVVFAAGIQVGLFLFLYRSLRTGTSALLAAAMATLVTVTVGVVLFPSARLVVVLVGLCAKALITGRHRPAVFFVAAAAAGFLLTVKISEGVMVAVAAGCVAVALPYWYAVPAPLVTAITGVLAWIASGQAVADLPAWARLVPDLILGYSDAMAVDPPSIVWALIVVLSWVALTLTALSGAWNRTLSRRDRLALGGLIALLSWIAAKQGFVRFEPLHTAFPLAMGVVLVVAVWGSASGRCRRLVVLATVLMSPAGFVLAGDRAAVALAPLFVLAAIPVVVEPAPRFRRVALAPLAIVVVLAVGGHLLLTGPIPRLTSVAAAVNQAVLTDELATDEAAARAKNALPGSMAVVRGQPVAADPWQISAVWAAGGQWHPVTIIQPYSAYTPTLDDLIADDATGPRRPAFVLRAGMFGPRPVAIDGRNPLWDTPRYQVSLICGTEPVASDGRWLLLQTAPNRCGPERTVAQQRVEPGVELPVPEPSDGEIVVASFQPDSPSLGQRALALLWRPAPLSTVTLDSASYRVPQALLAGPLVVSLPRTAGWPWQFGGGRHSGSIGFDRSGTVTFRSFSINGPASPLP